MDNLDEKLSEILHELASSFYYEGTSEEGFDEEVPEWSDKLKRAFIDTGYAPLTGDGKVKIQELINERGLMTGQEWYDRFIKHFKAEFEFPANNPVLAGQEIKRAAAMTNQEILEKAIRKAIENGWWYYGVDIEHFKTKPSDAPLLIFNHNFAKALWGEDIIVSHSVNSIGQVGSWHQPALMHHLQQMVISDDPIKYLRENI